MSDALDRSVSGIDLKRAMKKAFDVLGYSGVDILLSDLENHGVDLASDKRYQLSEIQVILEELFGAVSNLVMQRILRELS